MGELMGMDDEVFASVELLRVQPGDVIVARVDQPISQSEADKIKAKLREYFADNEIVVTPGTLRISLIRPEASA